MSIKSKALKPYFVVVRSPDPLPLLILLTGRFHVVLSIGLFGSEVITPHVLNIYKRVSEPNRELVTRLIRHMIKLFPLYILSWILFKFRVRTVLTHVIMLKRIIHNKIYILVLPPLIDTCKDTALSRNYDRSLLMVARISSEKNIEYFILIVDKLKRLFKDLKATIAGIIVDQKYYEKLRNLINQKELDNTIELVLNPDTDELVMLYRTHSVFFNPSQGALGLVNLEAASCGCLPVVHSEFIDGATPYGVMWSSLCEALTALISIFKDPGHLKERGLLAAQWVRVRSNLELLTKKIRLLFNH